MEDLYEIDEEALNSFLSEDEEQLDEKSSKSAKRKRRKKRKKKAKKKAKRDACYHKVRARYDVWPSAYASGALVKCRKVGASNWGNKSKKKNESVEEQLTNMIEEELRIVIGSLGDEKIPGGLAADIPGSMEDKHQTIADMHDVSKDEIDAEVDKGVEAEMEHTDDEEIAHEIAMDHVYEDPDYYTKLDSIEENELYRIIQEELAAVLDEKKKKRKSKKKKKKKKKKAGTESGKESNLGDWFGRKGAPGKKGGWVDCNTCRKGKCKPCGRKKGEKRAKYPSCRPTPGACKERGRGKSWGKKSAKGKK